MSDWPHKFTPDGKGDQIGEIDGIPKFSRPMVCVHCHKKFVSGLEPQPPGPCPARNDKREIKRLQG